MTAEDDRQLKAAALLELEEARERKNLVWEKAASLGKEFQGLADLLKTQPDNVASESYMDTLSHKALTELVADSRKALSDLQVAEEKARRLGCPTIWR